MSTPPLFNLLNTNSTIPLQISLELFLKVWVKLLDMALMSVSATSIISRYLTNQQQTTKTFLYILKTLGI